jgi:DNA-binding MarR family transcriptional regulator
MREREYRAVSEDFPRPKRPIEEVAIARTFYAALGQDVHYFSALWHTFNVGHMLASDLDRICRQYDLSFADFNLMGALRIDRPQQLRATDLAVTLQVSNSALTTRVAKLVEKGMLVKLPVEDDRRAFTLELTPDGAAKVEAILFEIARDSCFVRELNLLSGEDLSALGRIMGELHTRLDRYFVHAHR